MRTILAAEARWHAVDDRLPDAVSALTVLAISLSPIVAMIALIAAVAK